MLGKNTLIVLSLGALFGSALLGGCAEERDAIDRVQPYALDKALFVGPDLVGTQDDPEFYTQGTLVDVGYGASQDGLFTSTYAQPMSRIKWQITEGLLLGRIAYERLEGSDGRGLGGKVQDGVIAVAFAIESHFDIQNVYNATTGERQNIIEENNRDRPWYERQYFRVDWSRNLNTDSYDFDTLSLMGVYGGIQYEPMDYDVTDPNDPDAPVFDLENGYFDVTNRAFARPQVLDLSWLGWGIDSFPACFLDADFSGGTAPAASCNPVELTIRHSFRKVVDTDYEPEDWDGYRFQSYGAFTVERQGFNRAHGLTDEQWHRFITRYNIWERSHYYDDLASMSGPVVCNTPETTPFGESPMRDEDDNGTHDECEAVTEKLGVGGSRCDRFSQKCTLPFRERTVKPVVWYYTDGSTPEYFEPTLRATNDWDAALRAAVRSGQYAECVRDTGDQPSCDDMYPMYPGQQEMNEDLVELTGEVRACRLGTAYKGGDCDAVADSVGAKRGYHPAVIDIAKMDPIVVLCHSPVLAKDPAACGDARLPPNTTEQDCESAEPGTELEGFCKGARRVRMGDLRYHQVNVIPTPQTPSPWGIYTDAEDPLTGETISASINVWSHINDLISRRWVDTARYILGDLSTEDVTEGTYVRNWAAAAEAAGMGGVAPKLTADELSSRVLTGAGLDPDLARVVLEEGIELPAELRAGVRELKSEVHNIRATWEAPSANRAMYAARAHQAQGTAFEAQLMTPMVQELMGASGLPINEGMLNMTSPLRGGHPAIQRDLKHWKENALAQRGACIRHAEAQAPISMTALSRTLEEKFGRFDEDMSAGEREALAEKMRMYVATRAHYAVIVHEMGHSVGLRHNFVSSSDAFNYRPQYWQLRTKNGTVDTQCSDLGDGEDCVGPRYFDPVTKNERDNLLHMFMHSSVMDYAGETTQDFLGLGAYDFAAAKMFYGETVAVFKDESFKVGGTKATGMLGKMDGFGGILGFDWDIGDDSHHYSELNNVYGLVNDCVEVNPDDFIPATWNAEETGEWHPVLDGRIVSVDGKYTRCSGPQVDYARWDDLHDPSGEELNGAFYRGGRSVTQDGNVRVPYGFGTDGWADLGNLSVYRHDNGADAYELFDFFVTQQETSHIFDNYRRGLTTFSVRSAANRALGRYNEKMRDGAKGMGLLKNIYRDFLLNQGFNFDDTWPLVANDVFADNMLSAGFAFDHFARQLARPEMGPHFRRAGDDVLRSSRDQTGSTGNALVNVPNGATGYFGDIGIGGRPLENQLADDKGEYDSRYTINAGSYYDKMYTAMLFTESVDNFISSSRTDFLDARSRAVSLADLFPDGYRRWLANNLTNDDMIKGVRIAANNSGNPLLDGERFPRQAMGWTSWWGGQPRACFPSDGTTICGRFGLEEDPALDPNVPNNVAVLDPQVGWEQQKFLVAWTLMYLPENQQQWWLDQMRVWELGVDSDPGFVNRIEFHNPTGKVYVAKTFGKETIYGKVVQRGISARVLEYANDLLRRAYVVDPGEDMDNDGTPDWYLPRINPDTGLPQVRYDATVRGGTIVGTPGCSAATNRACTCSANRACVELEKYVAVPFFLREAMDAYGLGNPDARGIF